jgi:uncharacterized protein (UPF0335 family)
MIYDERVLREFAINFISYYEATVERFERLEAEEDVSDSLKEIYSEYRKTLEGTNNILNYIVQYGINVNKYLEKKEDQQ